MVECHGRRTTKTEMENSQSVHIVLVKLEHMNQALFVKFVGSAVHHILLDQERKEDPSVQDVPELRRLTSSPTQHAF